MRFRILITCFSLFTTFAIGGEGEVKHKEIRIYVTDNIYIKPEITLDINKLKNSNNTLEDTSVFVTSIVFEF